MLLVFSLDFGIWVLFGIWRFGIWTLPLWTAGACSRFSRGRLTAPNQSASKLAHSKDATDDRPDWPLIGFWNLGFVWILAVWILEFASSMGLWVLILLENQDSINRGYRPCSSSFPWNLGFIWNLAVWNLDFNLRPLSQVSLLPPLHSLPQLEQRLSLQTSCAMLPSQHRPANAYLFCTARYHSPCRPIPIKHSVRGTSFHLIG